MAKHILSVSYDEPLLRTREMLLRRQGYSVTSALGFTNAIEQCKTTRFDLFILGHSIPDADKRELMNVFRGRCDAPVLALRRHGDAPLNGADAHNYPDDIPGLLNTVEAMLEKHTRPQPIDKKPMLRREH